MRVASAGGFVISIGWIIALLVLIGCFIGALGAIPSSPLVVFIFIGALALAILLSPARVA